MGKLDNKIALITGATSGIGEYCAYLFADEGATVILLGRNQDRGKYVEESVISNGGRAKFYCCDITREEEVSVLADNIRKEYGYIDILFNNAGVFITAPLEEITMQDWQRTFDVNVTGCFLMTKFFISMLVKRKGVILNNASIAGMQSYVSGNSYMYSASKAAVIQFTKVCAKNYAKDVRINCICPGIVDTPIYINRDMSRFNDRIPMGRVSTPEDIAYVSLFLVSEDATYITGAVIPVDGGVSI